MELIDNITRLLGDDFKQTLKPGSRLKIAASCFSMYAFEALKAELEKIDELKFIFTSPTFVADEVTDKIRKERREFHIPKVGRERSLYGSEFEIQLRNRLTQRAIAKECADWMRRKATFKSNRSKAPMQQFACVQSDSGDTAYMPLHGFTAVDLGYQPGNAVSNLVNKMDEPTFTATYLSLFDQIWNDTEKLEDVTAQVCDHIASVYQENSPESIYFLMLYNIFSEFLDDIDQDVLPNDRTGYQDTLIWNKLFNYQKDAATGIINKLETYSGCILADSVGLGKTFTALAVVKYYELRNRSVLVLCPKKLADNWLNYNRNLKTNIFARDRFNYDVLCHTDLSRTSGESFGTPLNRINWGNYDLVVIDESHNFRNNDAYKDKETRYQKLMNKVIREGVKTKVLMLSATPVNNRFNDLRNQLALAYEGDSENLTKKLKTGKSVEEIFRNAQASFNTWSKLPPEERTARAILDSLEFDFFELLDSVTIARSRKHIQTFYDTQDIGHFPERRKPLSFHCPLTQRADVMGFNEIFEQLSMLKLAVYAPTRNGRVVVTELPEKLMFENEGSFFEGRPDEYVEGNKTPRRYRNPFLAQAMAELNMIDTMGYGIHQIYKGQARRYFPLPDYDLSEPGAVKVTVYGGVVDPAYSRLLIQKTDLPLADVLALDRVQKKLPIPDEAATRLKRMKLIEGRKPNFHVSAAVAEVTANKADYIRTRAQDDEFYAKLLTDYLEKFGQASRAEVNKLLLDKLSEALTTKQKYNKISTLLTKLRRGQVIVNTGSDTAPCWRLAERLAEKK